MWATSFFLQPFSFLQPVSFLQPFSFLQPVSFLQQFFWQRVSFLQRLFSWRVFFSLQLAWHPPYDGFLIGSLKLPALRNPCSTCCMVSYYNIQHIVGQWFYVNNQKKNFGLKNSEETQFWSQCAEPITLQYCGIARIEMKLSFKIIFGV
jgi:hypothetical protein